MSAIIRGIKPENRVVRLEKLADGSIRAHQASGNAFIVSADFPDVQAFIVYTMIHADEVAA